MIKSLNKLKEFINNNDLNGYIVPKNDDFFTEYSETNNLYKISNFSGSAGFAIILKNKNYLFVDGRYTLQAKKEAGKNFKIFEIPYFWPKNLENINLCKIGFDPRLFTENILIKYFGRSINLMPIKYDFENKKKIKNDKVYLLNKAITGETTFKGKLYLFIDKKKINYLKKKITNNIQFCNNKDFFKIINNLKKRKICIDKNTCSVYEQQILSSKFEISGNIDPIYLLKSIKNKTEIKNTIKAHIEDGVALTKFLYWFKMNKKKIDEKKIEKKLEDFRRKSKNYLYPSFDTIAGSGPNGAIIHYRSSKKTNRKIKKNDILLVDSGGQYKWGTTDVTRTTCAGTVSIEFKNNFTRVLKGHISVIKCDLKTNFNGHLIDKLARKFLKKAGLDYSHGTGHGVGFFLNVHEGPQSIAKNNKILLRKGMVLSNEPGYYLKDKYGIRIENLIYLDKIKNNLYFRNLTYAPIDLDMINFQMLTKIERKYLFDYHLEIYTKISKYLNRAEKRWLINLIK